MTWRISFSPKAERQLNALGSVESQRIVRFFRERVSDHPNPYALAKHLMSSTGEFWRFRVGDYRIVCRIEQEQLLIEAIAVGHRREVYR